MITEKDQVFMNWWERERERLNSTRSKLIGGLPVAVLFCIPILLFVTSVYLFFPEWYTKISSRLPGSIAVIIMAVIICILFFSYFRMQYKWESNEQHYLELKSKTNK